MDNPNAPKQTIWDNPNAEPNQVKTSIWSGTGQPEGYEDPDNGPDEPPNPEEQDPEEVSGKGWFGSNYNAAWGPKGTRDYPTDPYTGRPTHDQDGDVVRRPGWDDTRLEKKRQAGIRARLKDKSRHNLKKPGWF